MSRRASCLPSLIFIWIFHSFWVHFSFWLNFYMHPTLMPTWMEPQVFLLYFRLRFDGLHEGKLNDRMASRRDECEARTPTEMSQLSPSSIAAAKRMLSQKVLDMKSLLIWFLRLLRHSTSSCFSFGAHIERDSRHSQDRKEEDVRDAFVLCISELKTLSSAPENRHHNQLRTWSIINTLNVVLTATEP